MPADANRNAFIVALGEDERSRLQGMATPVEFPLGEVLIEPDEVFDALYFPLTCAVSLLTVMEDGESIEAGLIGREGLVGFSALLGEGRMPWRAVVQMPGAALRVPAEELLSDRGLVDALQPLAARYQGAMYWLATLTIACNRFHPVEQRCARWMLMINDRDDDDVIEVTHEFLSQMLGIRRQSVTETLHTLEGREVIRRIGQGRILIENRRGLEAIACECYERTGPVLLGDNAPF